jgi:hypothetical protein
MKVNTPFGAGAGMERNIEIRKTLFLWLAVF